MGRRRRVALVVGGVLAAFLLYEGVTSVVAYTDDAYVRSDLVAVAPEVTGRIIAVHVVDNPKVQAGDPLVTIDPEPFALAVAQVQSDLAEAQSQIVADRDAITAAQATYDGAVAELTFAQDTQRRIASLSRTDDVSRQSLDQANDDLRRAESAQAVAAALVTRARSTEAMHVAAQARATAELATANWRLSRTRLVAPVDGTINNLTVHVGDTGQADVPLIGIVDATAWRVIANYKQSYLRDFAVGQTGWVWLGSQPWHFHRARITGIGRGISRDQGPDKLLPYVAPTTDWIRLQRRFPVTLVLQDLPPDFPLFMGADARTIIFP